MITPHPKPVRKAVQGFYGPYAFLSNFYIEPDGTFVEMEYQRSKCDKWADRAKFDIPFAAGTLTPKQAKAIGAKVKLREEWEEKRIDIMTFYVTKKFRDHEDLRILLQLTGDMHLEETNKWGDTFWGVCNGFGTNVLGEILMQVRAELGPV